MTFGLSNVKTTCKMQGIIEQNNGEKERKKKGTLKGKNGTIIIKKV